MSRFVLTAQLQLQAPTNTRQVVSQMQQQLGNALNIPINPVINTQALSNAQKQLTKVSVAAGSVSKNLRGASRSAESFGSALGAAARRFASITLATGFFLGITRAMGSAVGRAVEFEKEMLKISQVTGKSVRSLQGLSSEVTRLATTFGVGSEEILSAARTLSQAGLAADQVTKSLRILTQTDLAATFDNIADTTEGAVALINQFRKEVRAAGSEAKFLENALDAINAVSKNFAVESADLISVVRRTGGVFEAAGGQLNELIALFTSVRSTTRETADTIATGFRTIFTRIQRTETLDSLRELGIVLQDTEGKFVGPLEAVKRLSAGLSALDPRDFRFNEIVEQLGGFRQIGKVIPLIKQYSTSVEALAVANNSMGSTARDAATAQQGLGNQFAQLKEKFDATIRDMVDSGTFRSLAEGAIKFAEAILRIVDALEPLLPILTSLAALKLGQIAVPALGRFAGMTGRNQGGKIHGFNSGGYVPGTGNRDTVPAMLTPGEFVIKKSSVNKIGASRLAKMNGYAGGGTVQRVFGTAVLEAEQDLGVREYSTTAANRFTGNEVNSHFATAAAKHEVPVKEVHTRGIKEITGPNSMRLAGTGALTDDFYTAMNEGLATGLDTSVAKLQELTTGKITVPAMPAGEKQAFIGTLKTKYGELFEQLVQRMSGAGFDDGQDTQRPIDLLGGIGDLAHVFPSLAGLTAIELKSSLAAANKKNSTTGAEGLHQKVINHQGLALNADYLARDVARRSKQGDIGAFGANRRRQQQQGGGYETRVNFASGGSVDTVPAMLTPGEYVINKKSAQQIGYGNLNRMNKQGVANFNSGGPVQFFANGTSGTGVAAGGGMNIGTGVNTSMEALAKSATTLSYKLDTIGQSLTQVVDDFAALQGIDEKINGAANALANTISTAVDDINVLQSIDDKLLGAIKPLAGSIASAGTVVSEGVQNFAAGMSTIDDTFKTQIESTVSVVKTSMADFAKGLTTIDKTLKAQFAAPGKAVERAMKEVEKHLNAFGKELIEKVTLFDTLVTPIENVARDLNAFATTLLGRLDDLNPMSSGAILLGNALNASGQVIAEASINVANALMAGATNVVKGMTNAISGIGGAGNVFAKLAAPVANVSKQMLNIANRLGGTYYLLSGLNDAILDMTKGLNSGAISVTQVSMASADTDQFFEKLEAAITAAIANINKTGAAAPTTGAPKGGGGVAVAGGGGGGGMAAMNNMMMLGMMLPMVTQQLGLFDDQLNEMIMTGTMIATMFGMVAASATESIVAKRLENNTTYQNVLTKAQEANASGNLVMAKNFEMQASKMAAATQMRVAGAAAVLTAGMTVAVLMFMHAKQEAENMAKGFTDTVKSLKEGGAAAETLAQSQERVRGALEAEAAASGGMWGAAIAVVVTAVAVALAPFTGGLSLTIPALIGLAAAGAAAAAAGYKIGESFASAEEGILKGGMLLTTALYESAAALGQLSQSQKMMELEQLDGIELLKRQNTAFEEFSAKATGAAGAMQAFMMLESGATSDVRADMDASEIFSDIRSAGIDSMKEMATALFEQAEKLRGGIRSTIDELSKSGKSIEDVLANKDVQKGYQNLGNAIRQAFSVQMLMTGQMKQEAKARLGLVGVLEENMSVEQRRQIATLESTLIQQEANSNAEKAMEAQKKADKERLEAEQKARETAEQKLRADIAMARASAQAAQAIDLFAVELLNFSGTMDSVMMEFGALTGSVKQYRTQNDKLIGTLTSGTITPEAEQAAMQTAEQFGIEGETQKLLEQMKETERIRKVLTEEGLREFGGSLSETASELKVDEFFKDQGIDLSGLDADIRNEILAMFEDGLTPDEIQEITGILNEANEQQIKVLQDLAKAQNAYLGALFKFGDAVIKAENSVAKAFTKMVDVQIKGAERLAKAQGRDLTVGEVGAAAEQRRNAPLAGAGLVGGGVEAINIQLERKRQRQQEVAAQIKIKADRGQTEEVIKLQNEQKKLNNETKLLKEGLADLADQAELAAAVMGEIEKERGNRETIQGLIKEFTFASNESRLEMDKTFVAMQRVLATGNINAVPDQMRGAVGGLLDRLKDIELRPGMTGGDISKRLQAQMANALAIRARGFGLNPQELKKIFESTTKEDKLINDLRAINAEEQAAATALQQAEFQQMTDLIGAIGDLIATLEAAQGAAGDAGGDAAGGGQAPQNRAQGGIIYAAEGQSISNTAFKPKGTDTVPAMLTPGEFVVNKKATSQNMGLLKSINSGKTTYLAKGGPVPMAGGDTVKPFGEFSKNLPLLKGAVTQNQSNLLSAGNSIKLSEVGDWLPGEEGGGGIGGYIRYDVGSKLGEKFPGWNNFRPTKMLQPFSISNNGALTRKGWDKEAWMYHLNAVSRMYELQNALSGEGVTSYPDTYKGAVDSMMWMATFPMNGKIKKPIDAGNLINAIRFFWDLNYKGIGSPTASDKTLLQTLAMGPPGEIFGGHGSTLSWLFTNQDVDDKMPVFGSVVNGAELRNIMSSGDVTDITPLQGGTFVNRAPGGQYIKDNLNALKKMWNDLKTTAGSEQNIFPDGTITNGVPFYHPVQWNGYNLHDLANMKNFYNAPTQPNFDFVDNLPTEEKTADALWYAPMLGAAKGLVKIDNMKAALRNSAEKMQDAAFGNYGAEVLANIYRGDLFKDNIKDFYSDPKSFIDNKDLVGIMTGLIDRSVYQNWAGGPGAQDVAAIGAISGLAPFEGSWNVAPEGDMVDAINEMYQNALGYLPWKSASILPQEFINSLALRNNAFTQAVNASSPNLQLASKALKEGNKDAFATTISNAFNGLFGAKVKEDIGLDALAAVNAQEEKEAADAAAQEAAEEAAAIQRLRRGFKIGYGTPEQKASTLFRVLGEAPIPGKTPVGVIRLPQDHPLFGKEGVFDPRIQDNRTVRWLTDVKRSPDHFDGLFPYFAALGQTVLGMGASGHVLAADENGNLVFNEMSLKGNLVKPGGKLPQGGPAELLSMNKKALGQMHLWSTQHYPDWENIGQKFDELMLGVFFGFKPIDEHLTRMQNSVRSAIIGADIANPARPWSDWFTQQDGQIPQWLKVGLPPQNAAGANQPFALPDMGFGQAPKPQMKAKGGPIGGVDWSPKGTDTVPAMLTPGEFVMQKSAVDKYGLGFMASINGGGLGNTGPYFANGGSVSQFGAEDTRIDRVLNTVKSNAKSINNTFASVGTVGSTANSIKNGQSVERTLSESIRDQVDGNSSQISNVMAGVEQTFIRAGKILNDMLDDDTAGDLSDSLDAMDQQLQGVNLGNMAGSVAIMSNAFMNDFAPRWLGFEQQFLQQMGTTFGLAQDFTNRMNGLKNDLNADALVGAAYAFATGGSVPGAGNRDTVPAMLTPGEFVMKKSAVGKYGNSFMSAINSGAIPQMFANGGPVIPTNFWMGNDGQPESQQSLQGLFDYFKPPGQTPLFGADTVKAYKNMMDFTGRGFWKKSGTSPFDPTKGNYKFAGVNGDTGLYVWDAARRDGLISGFSLTQYARKQAKMQMPNGEPYEATVPLFNLLGPYHFADTVGNVRGALGPAGDASLASLTGGPFAQLWSNFAGPRNIPGGNNLVRAVNNASYTFNSGLASQALSFLEKAVTDGVFNPIVNKKAFPLQRIIAGFGSGYSLQFAQGAVARKYPNIPLHHLAALTGKDFGVPSYFAKGGAARGTDTVPAMLTPGEFVMSKSAVERHGVGFMRSINKGHKGAPGMKHSGGVQYLSNADLVSGSGGLDFSALSNSINTLSSSIATAFNGFTSAFNGFSALSELLSSTIAQMSNIAINHNITVNGQLSIPGFSQEAINSIVNTIADQVASQSTGKLKQMFQNFRDRQDRRT